MPTYVLLKCTNENDMNIVNPVAVFESQQPPHIVIEAELQDK